VESSQVRTVLIVANSHVRDTHTAGRGRRLSAERRSSFELLIPDAPKSEHTDWTFELALPLLERAAGGPVVGLTGEQDPVEAIRRVLAEQPYDEVLISTLPKRVSKWLRRDLPRRIEGLGLPVRVITPDQERLRDQPSPWGRPRKGSV
jgi:hypothetical protein